MSFNPVITAVVDVPLNVHIAHSKLRAAAYGKIVGGNERRMTQGLLRKSIVSTESWEKWFSRISSSFDSNDSVNLDAFKE